MFALPLNSCIRSFVERTLSSGLKPHNSSYYLTLHSYMFIFYEYFMKLPDSLYYCMNYVLTDQMSVEELLLLLLLNMSRSISTVNKRLINENDSKQLCSNGSCMCACSTCTSPTRWWCSRASARRTRRSSASSMRTTATATCVSSATTHRSSFGRTAIRSMCAHIEIEIASLLLINYVSRVGSSPKLLYSYYSILVPQY